MKYIGNPEVGVFNSGTVEEQRLLGAWLLNEGAGLKVNNSIDPSLTGTIVDATWQSGVNGACLSFNGTSARVDFGLNSIGPRLSGASALTVTAWIRPLSNPAAGTRERAVSIACTDAAVGLLLGLYDDGKFEIGGRSQSSDTFQSLSGGVATLNKWHFVCGVLDFLNDFAALYVDGVLVASASKTFSSTSYVNGTTRTVVEDTFGNVNTSTPGDFIHASLGEVRIYKRKLSESEILDLSNDPFGLYDTRSNRIVYLPSGGGPTYTIAAGAGAFTLTGNAAVLKAARKIAAGTGDFVLTGNNTVLKAGRKIAAGTGEFALTGIGAALKLARKLTAGGGAFSLTGNDATLTYTPVGGPTYTIAASAGAFSLTGNNTVLKAGRKMSAGTGVFTETGNVAGLKVGRKMVAGAGAFTLTGLDAILKAARKLPAGTGVFTLTGSNVNLTVGSAFGYEKNNQLLVDSIGGKVLQLGATRINTWGTSTRPASPKKGTIGFNIETSALDIYDGSAWKSVTLS